MTTHHAPNDEQITHALEIWRSSGEYHGDCVLVWATPSSALWRMFASGFARAGDAPMPATHSLLTSVHRAVAADIARKLGMPEELAVLPRGHRPDVAPLLMSAGDGVVMMWIVLASDGAPMPAVNAPGGDA